LKEKGGSHQFLSETEKQFLMKYDIEVPTTLLKDEVLAKQREIFSMDENEEKPGKDGDDYSQQTTPTQHSSRINSSYAPPRLQRFEGSTNLLEDLNLYENEINSEKKEDNGKEGEGEGEGEGEEEEVEYFNPTKQNIIKKVVDFSMENKRDKDRLQALFTNKTFLTETKSFPVSMFISKPDIDDIDIDIDDDPELLQLKLGMYNNSTIYY